MAIDVRVSNAWRDVGSTYARIGGSWRTGTAVYQRRSGVWEKVWPTNYVVLNTESNDLDWAWTFGNTYWGGWEEGRGVSVEAEGTGSYAYVVSDDDYYLGHPPIKTRNLVDLQNIDDYNSVSLTYANLFSTSTNHVYFYILFCNSSSSYSYNRFLSWNFSTASGSTKLPATQATYTMSISDSQKSDYKTYIASYPYVRFGLDIYYNLSYSESQERDRMYLDGGTVSSIILQA